MVKIDKSYTIRFAYAGIFQYATIRESKGKIVAMRFSVSYRKKEHEPIIDQINKSTDINEILELIRSIAYCNRAEIYLISNAPIQYSENKELKDYVTEVSNKFDEFIKTTATEYFDKVLLPIMIQNKWFFSTSGFGYPILIYKNDENEWDNIPKNEDSLYFEYLCYKFLKDFNNIEINLTPEHGNPRIDCFYMFNRILADEYFKERNLLIEL